MKITASQFGVLCTLRDFGPQNVVEVLGPPKMDGSRKAKIEGFLLTAPTLDCLERNGLVSVQRGDVFRLKNAVGRSGLKRRALTISITDAGRAALGSPTPSGTAPKTEAVTE
jgi:hypothetical protein